MGPPPAESLERLTAQIVRRVYRRLVPDGWLVEDESQPWLELQETDALDALRAASIRYRVALGPGAGRRTATLVDPSLARPETLKPFTVNQQGFSLNAAVACPAHRRDRLERLCRYVTRPAIALERLSLNRRGEVLLALKRPFRDGTAHLRFTPEDFMARLAALVPRPRANLTRYHGVFAPAHPWRKWIRPAVSAIGYRRHEPERTALYRIVESTLPEFEAALRSRDGSTPRFVEREFHDYLACGRLEHGFVRVKCDGCRHEHLVAFSCKRRGFCPSCGARRMVETSAHLVDHVFPHVPVRQWVLSFPYPLRFLFASRPEALSRGLTVVLRAIETDLIQRAGLTRAFGARTGAVTVVQRFGSALNLNVHLHMLILDGVYTFERGAVRFHEVGPPPPEALERLTVQIVRRVYRRLVADGWLIQDDAQPWLDLEETDALDVLRAASIRYRVALGPGAGRRTSTRVDPSRERPETVKPLTVSQQGFSLNAAVACPADCRDRLERLCRYVTRPAIALERLSLNRRGEVLLALKRPFRDGTTHVKFTPEDFLARLAALVPRPRANLTRYHGVFAPAHPWRSQVTGREREDGRPRARSETEPAAAGPCHPGPARSGEPDDALEPEQEAAPKAPLTWAERLRRVFGIEITVCPHCGGRLRVIGDVTDPDVIDRILEHVRREGLPRAPPARSPVA